MKDGFVKVGTATPKLIVADVKNNVDEIISLCVSANEKKVKILVFPELCLCGATVGDLVFHGALLSACEQGLGRILDATKDMDMIIAVGLPYNYSSRNYDVSAIVSNGKILALVPKTYLSENNEFYEKRYFSSPLEKVISVDFCGQKTLFGREILVTASGLPELALACEIGDDVFGLESPSVSHVKAGANVIINLSASNELVGKKEYRDEFLSVHSARLACAYVYANAGQGESTTDLIFAGHDVISENGKILAESDLFSYGLTITEIDLDLLRQERTKTCDFYQNFSYQTVCANISREETALTRKYGNLPFIPEEKNYDERMELILSMQAHALAKRLTHTCSSCAVVGISGGLDSALALLVAVRAKELLPDDKKSQFSVFGITMPCFGTTNRTLINAKKLTKELGAKCVKISIRTAVNRHLSDIKHPDGVYDVTYENAQARERTQVLMDFANGKNGLVVGTGDMSELALGWATYNGDHMSMYGVNCSIPKTLVRHLVSYEGKRYGGVTNAVLCDILDTPISPELLPTDGKEIVQVTEDKVGPYELHDFFLYYFMRYAFSPSKILRIAKLTFAGRYSEQDVEKWLNVFVKRFFAQQFKRNCVPDGVKVGTVALSPRGDLRMPSDASANAWLDILAKL